ncbi:MAG: UbiH/UbiF/VisC/COQ6 family ubiquinone biosynthesis hydroxylase [Gammaproteobacteria bacterium]
MQSTRTSSDFDIAIVGGGMVGAALACALGTTPLRIALFDSVSFAAENLFCRKPTPAFDSRVSAIAPASQRFLAGAGAWDVIAATRVSPYSGMSVWDADGTGSIQFSAADIREPSLGHIVENSVILLGLYERLQQLANVSVISPVTLERFERPEGSQPSGSGVRVQADDGRSWTTTLLVGADGPFSKVRQLAGFATREWDYRHQALVTTVRTELPHHETALQRFMATGPLAFLPLRDDSAAAGSGQHYCSIVWSTEPEHAEQLQAMDDIKFATVLAGAIEHRLGAVEWVDQRVCFPLRQRHAVDYVQPNIALVGDAAHTIHPLAGQGVNLGFMDAQALALEIRQALQAQRPLGEYAILRRYQRARKGHNLGMMGVMEGFKFLFAQDALPVRWLRNTGMSSINRAGFIKNRLMRQAMGI